MTDKINQDEEVLVLLSAALDDECSAAELDQLLAQLHASDECTRKRCLQSMMAYVRQRECSQGDSAALSSLSGDWAMHGRIMASIAQEKQPVVAAARVLASNARGRRKSSLPIGQWFSQWFSLPNVAVASLAAVVMAVNSGFWKSDSNTNQPAIVASAPLLAQWRGSDNLSNGGFVRLAETDNTAVDDHREYLILHQDVSADAMPSVTPYVRTVFE